MICESCGKALPPPSSRGPTRKFCSTGCRQRAYRVRHGTPSNESTILAIVLRRMIRADFARWGENEFTADGTIDITDEEQAVLTRLWNSE